eukprot:12066291-Alexandrium_andersonii.AAC.1
MALSTRQLVARTFLWHGASAALPPVCADHHHHPLLRARCLCLSLTRHVAPVKPSCASWHRCAAVAQGAVSAM